ncbi:sperm flagellar protein 2 isoform X2 [Hyla sarda]|uniref:sperm flagellar protein 2 isoform X2 n=1 Tax=Hyla sarda TaxID=327740 RepID=UPI0024C22DA6|nr:sperm flagellar protein 2 isoform X2 [Hyla sarda]
MTEIICQWLNDEVGLSRRVEPKNFAKEFATGYLIGEVLHKYELQNDFDKFSQSRATNSKLNNFTRVEPTLQLLSIPFDQNVAQNIMSEQHGAATTLLYQLYIALQKKKKAGLTGVALETLRAAAPAKLQSIGSEIYRERLKTLVPRQSDISLQQVTKQFEIKAKEMEERLAQIQNDELRKIQKIQEELRIQDIEKLRRARRRQNEIMARIQAAIVQIPKPPPNRTLKAIEAQKIQKRKKEAEEVYSELTKFEKSVKKDSVTPNGRSPTLERLRGAASIGTALVKVDCSEDYVRKIQKRVEEDTLAREQREKRRRRILMEQLVAHGAQEALLKQAKVDREEEIQNAQKLYDHIAAERAKARYEKHYSTCRAVASQIVDLVTKIAEYRELTNKLIPGKLMREWKEIFFTGLPLYKEASIDPTTEQRVELEKESVLDEKDYEEYKTMTGEWILPDTGTIKPAPNNNILGHVVHRLMDIVHPPPAPSAPPKFPPFPIKGCVLGNIYSGKSTCLKHLAQVYGIYVLSVDDLVKQSLTAYQENEMGEEVTVPAAEPEEADGNKLTESFPAAPDGPEAQFSESISAAKSNSDSSDPQITKTPREQIVPKDQTLSRRAQLGGMMEAHLRKGKPVPDELLVQILVEAISHIPANTGWILDGFPATLNQAKLLEKSLTGEDPEKTATKSKKNKISTLVEDPAASQEPPPHSPALDFVAFIDVSDTIVLQRAAALNGGMDGAACPGDVSAMNQVPHRIKGFLDNWPKLEMWFSAQPDILVKVNGEVEDDVLCKKIEEVFLSALYNKQNQEKNPEKKEESPPPPATPPPPPPPPAETTQEPPATTSDKKTSAKKGKGRSKSPKDSSVEKKDTPRGKDSAPKSPKSGSPRGRSPGKKTKSVPTTPEPSSTPPPAGPPPIMPGSVEWVYVKEPLPQEVPEFLVSYWETIEKTYENHVKVGLRSLRQEQLIMIHYLYDIRNQFKEYLRRPDHKQEFVSQWQSDFNSIAEDMREDEETKAELHQRVDDLRDCLWDICDNRKEENEQERADVMSDGWLEDHLGILINHYFSLMQVEVDRFQDTMRYLRNYYDRMENKIPSEGAQEFVRIPLLDMSNTSSPEESDNPRRIPLIPRRPQTPEVNSAKQKSKPAAGKGKEDPSAEVTGQLSEGDHKLIHDAWQTALTAIANMISTERQALEAEEEKERQMLELKEKERVKVSQSSQKGAKKKSPDRKKGGKSPGPAAPTPQPSSPEDNSELQKKQQCKMKMKQEYMAALECEETSVNSRLELVKAKALEMCQEIVTRAEQAYKDMDMWLGAQFLAEMSSIGKLIQIAHHCVETSTKIQYELVLEQTDFYINSDIKVIADPVPQPRPPPVENPPGATLTVSQLRRLHKQFLQVAPDGLMSSKLFSDILVDLTSMTLGDDALPDVWMHLPLSEIQEITSVLSDSSNSIHWRKFLLSVSSPWPYPSLPQLLKTLQRFKAVDDTGCGTVREEQYNKVELWFTGKTETEETEPEDPTEPLPFNRLEHLIRFFFDLFAEHTEPPCLDYTDMLLYFASYPDPQEGFYRALSVTIGRPVIKPPDDNLLVKSFPAMDAVEENKERTLEKDDDDICPNIEAPTITMLEVLRVFQHGAGDYGDTHRFRQLEREANNYHKIIKNIFNEMGPDALGHVSLPALLKHPIFHELVEDCQLYKLTDIRDIVEKNKATQSNEVESVTTSSAGT